MFTQIRSASRSLLTMAVVGIAVSSMPLAAYAENRAQLEEQAAILKQRQSEIVGQVTGYAISHPVATGCAMATAGGAVSLFADQLNQDPDVQNAMRGAGAACAIYCVFVDSDGCGDAVKVLLPAALNYSALQDRISTVTRQLQASSQ